MRQVKEVVFFANDILAAGAIDALRTERCLMVPRDTMLASFNDIGAAWWPRYQLTTVRQPVERIVEEALARAMLASEGRDGAQYLRIPGELIVLLSTLRETGAGA